MGKPAVDADEWLRQQVTAVGFEDGADLPLLVASDFTYPGPAELDESEQQWLYRTHPARLDLGDARYRGAAGGSGHPPMT
jgi:hypothetical protein